MTELRGVISPFTTPFTETGEINLDLVKPQVDWLIDNGVHGLAAGGSTGEGHALGRDEYRALMEETAKAVDGRVIAVHQPHRYPLPPGGCHCPRRFHRVYRQPFLPRSRDCGLRLRPTGVWAG